MSGLERPVFCERRNQYRSRCCHFAAANSMAAQTTSHSEEEIACFVHVQPRDIHLHMLDHSDFYGAKIYQSESQSDKRFC